MIGGLQNIPKIPELKKKILFTLLMLAVYRVGCHIPTPGIDGAALAAFFGARQGTLFGLFDMFSGGALSQMSVMALGIMPYISASIILELMTVVVPYLEKLKKEGEQGRKKITQYTRYGTVILSVIQGFGIAVGLENMTSPGGVMVVPVGGWGFRVLTVITLTAGTSFLMWLGEQITERGIGNGISLIIFSGIVAGLPVAVMNSFRLMGTGEVTPFFYGAHFGSDDRCGGCYRFCGTWTAKDSRAVCKASGGTKDVWGTDDSPPFKSQYCWRYSTDFRFVHYHVPRDHCKFFERRGISLAPACCQCFGAGTYRLHLNLCDVHFLFLLFLYGGSF